MSESIGFKLLHKEVQRWVWSQNWTALRDIQERAIEPILNADCDLIISASTAAGKTEAAFLPACSRLAKMRPKGVGILYISPLKALINDQFRRLESLGEILDIPITPWHGDVSRSLKDKQKKNPEGIILITPESLESLLLNHGGWCGDAFSALSYIIIDEFHAFLGTERGYQLQSLMHRLEFMLGRVVPRIALSATLSDMEQVAAFLRPASKNYPYKIIESNAFQSDLKLQLRGYLIDSKEPQSAELNEVIHDLYVILRGKSHLIFANSRQLTEKIAVSLAELCEKDIVPNEFFPHHGSLSKEIRESVEKRLQEGLIPTSAVCTMTLELGIDIGSVDSIAQVTAPHSVASLRQRLGRSGRRGEAAVLRLFIPEIELLDTSSIAEMLRMETVQSIAMINLLLNKWCEPAPREQYQLSTLIQQTLSVIGQYGGVQAYQLWSLLCETGPFSLVDQNTYSGLLKALGQQDFITQSQDGVLVLGLKGEKLVEDYHFYTAFNTPEEYRVEYKSQILGTIPINIYINVGEPIIFAGKKWVVQGISTSKKIICLRQSTAGHAPKFGGSGLPVHDLIRREMRRIYMDKALPNYLDAKAKKALSQGIDYFHDMELDRRSWMQITDSRSKPILYLTPWLGDQISNTIVALLRHFNRNSHWLIDCTAGVICIRNCDIQSLYPLVQKIIHSPQPSSAKLASRMKIFVDKYDHLIPKNLRNLAYGKRFFDVDGAVHWLKTFCDSLGDLRRNSD
ncbi:MAG: DEAD/DEAH box helicase [Bradymonadales bacterium]|jgi:ATP-dependent Lhr-like helicase